MKPSRASRNGTAIAEGAVLLLVIVINDLLDSARYPDL